MNIDRKTPIGKAVDTSHDDDRPEVEGHGRKAFDPMDRRAFGEQAAESEPEVEGHRRLNPLDRKAFDAEQATPDEAPDDDAGSVEGIRRF